MSLTKALPRVNPFLSTYRGLRFPTSPLPSLELFRDKYGHTYELFIGTKGWAVVTENAQLIDRVLRGNHRNYGKSPVVTEVLASYIGKGLLTSDGNYWRTQRRLIQPGFSRDRLSNLVKNIQEEVEHWTASLQQHEQLDIYQTTLPLALQIMSKVLFSGTITPEETRTIAYSVELGQEDFAKEIRQPLLKPWRRLTNSRAAADAEAKKAIGILLRQIETHRERPQEFNDLLSMLIEARYDDGSAMSNQQLVDEALVLILAGHETTAISLACTIHLLSKHPDWAHKARTEWRTVTSQAGLNAASLRQLPILTAIINEGLRLFPPGYLISRIAKGDDQFEGVDIHAGQLVLMYVYGAHRNEMNFDRPLHFDPDRYLSKKTKTNFAFGGGPRLCVGYHLAMMEMQIALGMLLDKFAITTTKTELSFSGSATLRPINGVPVTLISHDG